MKIILKKNIENLGKKGEIKEVANGYARNFLIPNKLAVLAVKKELENLKKQKKLEAVQAEKELGQIQKTASQLDGFELEIPVKIGKDKKLFGAVSSSLIAEKLKENQFKIKKSWIKLKNPIKELGEHDVPLELPHNLETKIKIIITEEK